MLLALLEPRLHRDERKPGALGEEADWKTFDQAQRIAKGAAMMANCEVAVDVQASVWPVRNNQKIAEVIHFLCGDEASAITGTHLDVPGRV